MVPRALASIVVGPLVAIVVIGALRETVVFFFFIFSPLDHHVAEFRNGSGLLAAEILEDVDVEEALMVAVDDVVFSDVGDGGAILQEMLRVISQGLILGLFALGHIMTSTYASQDSLEVVDEESAESRPGVDDVI